MKLLLVFVSAFVLIARCDVAPAVEEGGVYEFKPEAVPGYAVAAGQEVEGAAPQAAFAEQAPGVRVFGAEPAPRAYEAAEAAAEGIPLPEAGVYVPTEARACTNSACLNVCRRLGFLYGKCISVYTCWCHN